MTNVKMRQTEKLQEIEEKESGKEAETLKCRDQKEHKDNSSVKMAMAAELIEMGISKASAHRLLNIK